MKPTDFAKHLTDYLSSYLPGQRGMSTHTIRSYRDTFSLFLGFCKDVKKIRIEKFTLNQFSKALIEEFLRWLETERGNGIATRNQRLAAIHAFCRYVQTEEPGHLLRCQEIIAITFKKQPKTHIQYLSAQELTDIFAKPNLNAPTGRRDLLLLSLLYDTGARVSELIDLKVRDVRLDDFPVVKLTGKGNKVRHVPLMKKTAALLESYLAENRLNRPEKGDYPLFFNRQHQKLTRPGITYILQKYTGGDRVTPHVLRHSKAMHLLQGGVNIVYIRDLLGHVDIATTEIYARADTEMKRTALQKVYKDLTPPGTPTWNSDADLMGWLHSLG
jgi:site-specific recombinase XerD